MTATRILRSPAARRLRRDALIKLLASDEGMEMTRAEIAARVGLSVSGLRRYLRGDFWEQVQARRAALEAHPLAKVDEAMLDAAKAGHVGAARLVYLRLAGQLGEQSDAPGDEDVDTLLRELDAVRARLQKGEPN